MFPMDIKDELLDTDCDLIKTEPEDFVYEYPALDFLDSQDTNPDMKEGILDVVPKMEYATQPGASRNYPQKLPKQEPGTSDEHLGSSVLQNYLGLTEPAAALASTASHGCSQCEERFYTLRELTSHLFVHQALQCGDCKRRVNCRESLRAHYAQMHPGRIVRVGVNQVVNPQKSFAAKANTMEHRARRSKFLPTDAARQIVESSDDNTQRPGTSGLNAAVLSSPQKRVVEKLTQIAMKNPQISAKQALRMSIPKHRMKLAKYPVVKPRPPQDAVITIEDTEDQAESSHEPLRKRHRSGAEAGEATTSAGAASNPAAANTPAAAMFACGKCEKKFGTQNELSGHELIHNGIKCGDCKARFKKPDSLLVHYQMYHPGKAVRIEMMQ